LRNRHASSAASRSGTCGARNSEASSASSAFPSCNAAANSAIFSVGSSYCPRRMLSNKLWISSFIPYWRQV